MRAILGLSALLCLAAIVATPPVQAAQHAPIHHAARVIRHRMQHAGHRMRAARHRAAVRMRHAGHRMRARIRHAM